MKLQLLNEKEIEFCKKFGRDMVNRKIKEVNLIDEPKNKNKVLERV